MRNELVFLCERNEIVGFGKYILSADTSSHTEIIHGHHLSRFSRNGERLVAIFDGQIFVEFEDWNYPYKYEGFEDSPVTLGDLNKLEKCFKHIIAWDWHKTIENSSAYMPVLHSLPQNVSVSCLRQHGISKEALICNVEQDQDVSMSCNASIMDPVLSDEELFSEVQRVTPNEYRDSDRIQRPSRSPFCNICVNLESEKKPYRYHKRKKGSSKPISKLQVKRDTLYRLSFQKNPFESPRDCCNAACFHYVNPEYAVVQYRRFLKMCRTEKKRALKSMYHPILNQFRFDGEEVCSRFLSQGFHFSFCLPSAVKGNEKARASASISACPREIKTDTKKDAVIQFLREKSDTIGDAIPTSSHTNLPLMNKTQVFERYLQENEGRQMTVPVSKNYFFKVWKNHCSSIKAHIHHGFTVCDACELLRSEMASCENEETQQILRGKMEAHYELMSEERRGYTTRRDLAIRYPGNYCSIIVDGADQKSYGLPHFVFNTKGDKGHKLKVKMRWSS